MLRAGSPQFEGSGVYRGFLGSLPGSHPGRPILPRLSACGEPLPLEYLLISAES